MISGWIIGDEEIVKRLSAMPGKLHDGLLRRIIDLSLDLEGRVKFKLSGEVLNVQSNTLRSSIHSEVQDDGFSITGKVGTNVPYAHPHEYGFKGTVTVKESLRTIKEAFGKDLKSPVTFSVRSHSRKMNLPERSFLRSALREAEGQIKRSLENAVENALKE